MKKVEITLEKALVYVVDMLGRRCIGTAIYRMPMNGHT